MLAEQKDITHIIIETTGIAEPLPISWTLGRDPLIQLVRLDAVVTVVDASEHVRHLAVSPSVQTQVEYADILVVSKIDLVSPDSLESLLESLQKQNEFAPVIVDTLENIVLKLEQVLADPKDSTPRSERGRSQY